MTVLELLSDKSRWTRGVVARDKDGCPVGIKSDEAVCYCLLGALMKVYDAPSDLFLEKRNLVYGIIADRHFGGIGDFNDCATYEQVISIIKEAGV